MLYNLLLGNTGMGWNQTPFSSGASLQATKSLPFNSSGLLPLHSQNPFLPLFSPLPFLPSSPTFLRTSVDDSWQGCDAR